MSERQRLVKLDIDKGLAFPTNRLIDRRLASAGYRRESITRKRSPGGAGWHLLITVTPAPKCCVEVVALQSILGSDPAREAHNLLRAKACDHGDVSEYWRDRFNVLYD